MASIIRSSSNWLRSFRRKALRSVKRRPEGTRLILEQLEDRWLPSFMLRYSTDGGATFSTPVSDNGTGHLIAIVNSGGLSIAATSQDFVSPSATIITMSVSGTAPAGPFDLVVQASVNGITTTPPPQTLSYNFSGSLLPNGGSCTMQTWLDNNNIRFDTAGSGIVGDTGSKTVNLGGASSTGAISFSGGVPYAVTTQMHALFTGPASVSLNSNDTILPSANSPVTIGDFVWRDLNGNGIQDNGEPGIPNVTLTLTGTRDGGSSVTDHATTDNTGHYLFTEQPGTYTVSVDNTNFSGGGALVGYVATPSLQGNDRSVDSNANNSATTPADLQTSDLTIDFGYYQPAGIGDFLWDDYNGNGLQDAGEPGLTGYNVHLHGVTGTGVVVDADQLTVASLSLNGVPLGRGDGNILGGLGNVTLANVHACVADPYLFTGLAPGTYTITFSKPADYVFTGQDVGSDDQVDSDADITTGMTGSYTLASGQYNLTVDAGVYKPVAIGNFVWNDTNGNGIQDNGEPGIPGVTLTLTGTTGSGQSITQTTTTDANGLYQFTEPPGTYTISVTTPAGYVPTVTGQGTTATDSNPSPSGTTPGTLPSGGSDQTVDFGFYQNVTIGNFVWNDTNGNGIQDNGEPGIPGVTLTLTGTNGSGQSITQTTTTDANGFYQFTEAPGTYTISVTTPTGYVPTATGQGTTATDSNLTPSGTTPGTLPSGGSDQTIDFGFYQNVTIGNFVRNSANGGESEDHGEPRIPRKK